MYDGWFSDMSHTDAKRIVACVNACTELSNDDLEWVSLFQNESLKSMRSNNWKRCPDCDSHFRKRDHDFCPKCPGAEEKYHKAIAEYAAAEPARDWWNSLTNKEQLFAHSLLKRLGNNPARR